MTTYTSLTDKLARKQLHQDLEHGRKCMIKIRPIDENEGRLTFQESEQHIDQTLKTGDKLVIYTQDGFEELFYGRSV